MGLKSNFCLLLLIAGAAWVVAPANAEAFLGEIEVPEGYPEKKGVLITLHKEGQKNTLAPISALIDQKNDAFTPHLLVLPVGSTIRFQNSDPHLHTIQIAEGPLAKTQLTMLANKKSKDFKIMRTGVSELLCSIHAQMRAFIVAIDTPFYSISDDKGQFQFAEIPHVPFIAKVWHETLPHQTLHIANKKDLTQLKRVRLKTWQ